MGLIEIRKELDEIDRKLVELFRKRMEFVEEVAKDKLKSGKAVFDGKREEEKLNAVSAMVEEEDPAMKAYVRELFSELMTLSRRRQVQYLKEAGRSNHFSFQKADKLIFPEKKLAFQGLKGAYSYLAGRRIFPDENMISVLHFRDVFDAVEEGRADYGILPMDNSTYGMVQDNYDLLNRYPTMVVLGEIHYPVSHCLCSRVGEGLDHIKKVYSHPQALSQCRDFFYVHPDIEQIPSANTAIAAKELSESGEEGAAVLCSKEAAEYYGLSILREQLSKEENATRFFIFGKEKIYTEDAYKLSISLIVPDNVGSLYQVLGSFMCNGLSLSMIQSRPVGDGAFSYRFFIDVIGNLSDSRVENALSTLKEEGVDFRILGNYPKEK